ncbi:class I SAM-dependent methyltransferase [Streptomyces sp. NPDC050448]|uniref:class I SAM-dependent methyltransferase n=1 Tax=Streptomyces sp. NPDC050448 TaxID=3155404 RepID=UPI00343F4824
MIASDLTPELLDVGRQESAARGGELRRQEADAEALPFADGAFDSHKLADASVMVFRTLAACACAPL